MAGLALLFHTAEASVGTRGCAEAVYFQQQWVSKFVARCYPHGSIAANDIGAICFRSDIRLLDLPGLADQAIFRAKKVHGYTTAVIRGRAEAEGTQIAIVYDSWFSDQHPAMFGGPALPPSWIRVGRWHTLVGPRVTDPIISFYAVRPDEAAPLATRLADFAKELPWQVRYEPDFVLSKLGRVNN